MWLVQGEERWEELSLYIVITSKGNSIYLQRTFWVSCQTKWLQPNRKMARKETLILAGLHILQLSNCPLKEVILVQLAAKNTCTP